MVAKTNRPQADLRPTRREKAEFRAVEDVGYTFQPSFSSAPPFSSFGVEATLAAVLD